MGNTYTSKNQNYLLDTAGIDDSNRKIVWYRFRKLTATCVLSESDDITTADVLRSAPENMKNYARPTPKENRAILENIDGYTVVAGTISTANDNPFAG